MKAWLVTDGETSIYCRAETRSAAKAMWPEHHPRNRELFLALRATREPRLDGPGPVDYIHPVYAGCEHVDHYGCGCWEWREVDFARTAENLRILHEGRAEMAAR